MKTSLIILLAGCLSVAVIGQEARVRPQTESNEVKVTVIVQVPSRPERNFRQMPEWRPRGETCAPNRNQWRHGRGQNNNDDQAQALWNKRLRLRQEASMPKVNNRGPERE